MLRLYAVEFVLFRISMNVHNFTAKMGTCTRLYFYSDLNKEKKDAFIRAVTFLPFFAILALLIDRNTF